ncbi:hypothetical protein Y032_0898g2934 [Ancylostoma ceylanicum]|uniref:Uncharacterized protein n=1 Tax=Ancylostoma ceylanicum TaxID=53326 RepID=A0A016WAW3_9BILA|nr:hypothetical protein Y032_0898g2934 [Ancylostoma ceylanicum]
MVAPCPFAFQRVRVREKQPWPFPARVASFDGYGNPGNSLGSVSNLPPQPLTLDKQLTAADHPIVIFRSELPNVGAVLSSVGVADGFEKLREKASRYSVGRVEAETR